MKHKRLIVIVTAAALLLLAGGIAWAADREPAAAARQQFSVVGDVVSIEGDEVMVQPEGGQEVSVLLGDETHQWLPGEPPTTTLSLAVGDPVLVLGRPARNGAGEAALIARFILIAEREDLPRYVVRGQAVAVTAQTIVVQTGQSERAITVGRATRLWLLQGRLESLRDVKAGDRVLAVGQPTELGQWQAGAVLAVGTTATAQPALRGEVTAIDLEAGTLEVETARGPVTVVTGEDTRYRLPGVEDPGLDDIQVGDRIVAVGRPESRDPLVFAARVIGILPAREEQASAPPDA